MAHVARHDCIRCYVLTFSMSQGLETSQSCASTSQPSPSVYQAEAQRPSQSSTSTAPLVRDAEVSHEILLMDPYLVGPRNFGHEAKPFHEAPDTPQTPYHVHRLITTKPMPSLRVYRGLT